MTIKTTDGPVAAKLSRFDRLLYMVAIAALTLVGKWTLDNKESSASTAGQLKLIEYRLSVVEAQVGLPDKKGGPRPR